MTTLARLSRYGDAVPLLSRYRFYRALLFVAVGLTLAMALLSPTAKQVHHDEYDHVNAARFYFEHWLPPGVGDPRTRDSHSLYGFSYLNEWDIVYPLAGKFAGLIRPAVGNDVIALRLFNVGLLLVLACTAFVRRDDTLVFVLLLTSPQIWYVFSYFNGDAFPMFLSFLAALALTSPSSLFNDRTRSTFIRYLPIGICIGLLVISKRSFWAFGLFAFCCAIWLDFPEPGRTRTLGALLRNSGLLALIILVTVLPRVGYDFIVNGTPAQKSSKIAEGANALALPYFKASTNMKEEARLKSKGVGLFELMKPPHRWAELSAKSAFGYYNYNQIPPRPSYLLYYAAIIGLHAVFVVYLAFVLAARGDGSDKVMLLGSIAFSVLIIALSIFHSWVNENQPQGRYLFGIFAIWAVALARGRRAVDARVVNLFVLSCFLLSVYSFCVAGLANASQFRDISEINIHFRRQ